MILAGSHVSSAKGYLAMGKKAKSLGATTFAFFTRNPRGGAVKPLNLEDIKACGVFLQENGIEKPVAHAPYAYNPCAAKEDLRVFAREAMQEDLARLAYLPGCYYNFHPGCHVGQGEKIGIAQIAQLLNEVITPKMETTVLLETMAGKGTELGSTFEELYDILAHVTNSEQMGVCFDTCHVWDAGYDIAQHLDDVLTQFDKIIGLSYLKAVHCNDSVNPCAAHKDRHAKLGEGAIGLDAFSRIVKHPALQGLPFILETPNDDAGWAKEIALLQAMQI